MSETDLKKIAWFATKGSGTNEAERIKALLSFFPGATELPFSKGAKYYSFKSILQLLRRLRPALLVMEGTGIAGGLACMLARILWKIPYVVSSGDAVGPFIAAHVPIAGPFGYLYEILLYSLASGYIGWTPYLCGRALTLGAKRAVTAPGWVLGGSDFESLGASGQAMRRKLGIPGESTVVGIVGALDWNQHRRYCYGLELVRCAHRLKRKDVVFLIVGDGSGIQKLREEAGELLGTSVFLPGAVPLAEVMTVLSAMDIGSLPQSMDGVGLFRYTTKISEYVEAGLPVITSRIPMAYDLCGSWAWRLPGDGPWDEVYIAAVTGVLESISQTEIERRRMTIPRRMEIFTREEQIRRVTDFIKDLL